VRTENGSVPSSPIRVRGRCSCEQVNDRVLQPLVEAAVIDAEQLNHGVPWRIVIADRRAHAFRRKYSVGLRLGQDVHSPTRGAGAVWKPETPRSYRLLCEGILWPFAVALLQLTAIAAGTPPPSPTRQSQLSKIPIKARRE
jgi:hypothetical protein